VLNASGFTVEDRGRLGPLVSGEILGWWMLDLARVTADCKFTSLLFHLQKCF